jgi:hypothetical protein
MSQFIDECNEQNEHTESLIRKMLYHDSDNNFYINMIDSGLSESDVEPISDCEDYRTALQLFRLSIGEDINGNPAINTVSISEGSLCIDSCAHDMPEPLVYKCFYKDASGNIYLGVKQGFDSEVANIISNFTGTYTADQLNALNTFIVGVKDLFGIDLLNEKFDTFYILAAANNTDAQLNLCNLGSHTITEVNAPTFTAFRGYAANGVNSYLNTNYSPANDGVNLVSNNSSYGFYSRTSRGVGTSVNLGSRNIAGFSAFLYQFANNGGDYIGLSQATTGAKATTTTKGFFITSRPSSSNIILSISGDNSNIAQASTQVLTNQNQFIHALNTDGSPILLDTLQTAFVFHASSLNASQCTSFYNLLQSYLTVLGAQI